MTKQHISILRGIIDNYSHNITASDAREAIETLREKIGENERHSIFKGDDGEIYFCIEG